MKHIRGLSGFGDAIYLRVIVEWLLKNRPDEYTIYNNFPDVFNDLPVTIKPYTINGNFCHVFSYLPRKYIKTTTQFQDMLIVGGLSSDIELRSYLKTNISKDKIIIVDLYHPMGGHNPATSCMTPYREDFNDICRHYENTFILDKKLPFNELVNLFNSAKLVIAQNGWAVPMSEMLDIPNIICYTKRGLNSNVPFLYSITPEKILHKKTSSKAILR